MKAIFYLKIVFEAALEVAAVVSESYYDVCDRVAGTGRNFGFF